jgi:regulator of cell morphogenesis and NO signaling
MSILLMPKKARSFSTSIWHNTELTSADRMRRTPNVFDNWELDHLTDYIITTHHSYIRDNAAVIYDLAQEVANKHGEKHPELLKLTEVAFLFFHDLLNHLKKEEQILFPKIKQLYSNRNCKEIMSDTTVGLIRERVMLMKKEHLAAGKDLKLFYKLTHGYLLPVDACSSYKYFFKRLIIFENDMVSLINLENNILFPKAIALAEELLKSKSI